MVHRVLILSVASVLLVLLATLLLVNGGRDSSTTLSGAASTTEASTRPPALDQPRSSEDSGEERELGALATDAPPAHEVASPEPRSRVSGLVLDADTGAPIDPFEIVHGATAAGGTYVDTLLGYELLAPQPSRAFVGTGGRFDLADLDPVWTNLRAAAPGYTPSTTQYVDLEVGAARENVVLRLHRAATVSGRVIEPVSGAPVLGALVAWLDERSRAHSDPNERFVRTDALGRFVIDAIPPGTRRIIAAHEEAGEGITQPLELAPGIHPGEVVIELVRSGAMDGRITPGTRARRARRAAKPTKIRAARPTKARAARPTKARAAQPPGSSDESLPRSPPNPTRARRPDRRRSAWGR